METIEKEPKRNGIQCCWNKMFIQNAIVFGRPKCYESNWNVSSFDKIKLIRLRKLRKFIISFHSIPSPKNNNKIAWISKKMPFALARIRSVSTKYIRCVKLIWNFESDFHKIKRELLVILMFRQAIRSRRIMKSSSLVPNKTVICTPCTSNTNKYTIKIICCSRWSHSFRCREKIWRTILVLNKQSKR